MNQRNLYISDLHLFHKNVTKAGKNFDSRPYENIEEMNDDILQRWNNSVTNIDHVYICGDLIWKFNNENRDEAMRILNAMNGNLHLIVGNHDKVKSALFKKRFEEIVFYKRVQDYLDGEQVQVVLSHYYMPFYEGHYHNTVLIHGHSHVTEEADLERKISKYLNDNGFPINAFNVGCMYPYMDYTPKTLQQISDGYKKWIGGLYE